MSVIISAVERYKDEFGQYPKPAYPTKMGPGSSSSLRVGGALMLYQVLTRDGDDQILIEKSPNDRSPGTRPSVGSARESYKPPKDEFLKGLIQRASTGWMLVDAFGHPFQYECGGANTINATYDIWSFGHMPTAVAPSAPSKIQKQDETLTRSWIKNW